MKNNIQESKLVILVRKIVGKIESYIIKTLILLMSVLLIMATIELAYKTVRTIIASDSFIIDVDSIMELFGIFLLVLIGIELLDTIKVYFKKNVVHVEVVILVALIAIARKIIVLDFKKYDGIEIIGIGFIIISLATSYYLIKKAGGCQFYTKEKKVIEIDPETQEPEKIIKETTSNQKDIDKEKITKTIETKPPPCSGNITEI